VTASLHLRTSARRSPKHYARQVQINFLTASATFVHRNQTYWCEVRCGRERYCTQPLVGPRPQWNHEVVFHPALSSQSSMTGLKGTAQILVPSPAGTCRVHEMRYILTPPISLLDIRIPPTPLEVQVDVSYHLPERCFLSIDGHWKSCIWHATLP
jgi:hypothetical protein